MKSFNLLYKPSLPPLSLRSRVNKNLRHFVFQQHIRNGVLYCVSPVAQHLILDSIGDHSFKNCFPIGFLHWLVNSIYICFYLLHYIEMLPLATSVPIHFAWISFCSLLTHLCWIQSDWIKTGLLTEDAHKWRCPWIVLTTLA